MIIQIARLLKPYRRADSGSMTVEFVATLPMALGALVVIFEFGRALWAHHILTKDVRDATRFLARAPLTAAFITQAENIIKSGDPSGGDLKFPFTADSNVNVDTAALTFSDVDFRVDGTVIEVTATVPLHLVSLGFLGDALDITLNVTDRARHIGE